MESIKAYLKEIRHIPLLRAEEEVELAKKIKSGNNKEAKEARKKMIRSNLRLVINIAKRYIHFGVPLMDLIEEGNMGLMKAVEKFNYKRGYRFSTYAAWWIRQSISRSISEQGKLIRVPVYMNDLLAKCKKASERLSQKLGRVPTNTELSKAVNVPAEKIQQIHSLITKTSSLDAPIGEEGEDQVKDLIEDTAAEAPDNNLTAELDKERITALLHLMSKRERTILDMRFGLTDGNSKTLAEVAKKMKVSRERVRQIEEATLKKLRKFVTAQDKEKT